MLKEIIIIFGITTDASIPVMYTNGTLLDGFENITDWHAGSNSIKGADTINFKEVNKD